VVEVVEFIQLLRMVAPAVSEVGAEVPTDLAALHFLARVGMVAVAEGLQPLVQVQEH